MAETEGRVIVKLRERDFKWMGAHLYNASCWLERERNVDEAIIRMNAVADALGYKLVKKEGE